MIPILTVHELDTLYKPGDTELNDTPFCRAIPQAMRQHMTAVRFRDLAYKGPMPPFVKLAGLAGTHAWQMDAVIKPYLVHIAVFDIEPLLKARTFDAALDLLDALRDNLESVPKMRSAVIREVVNAASGMTDEQRAELAAYGRAAGM
jgi:hypothetical protein